MNKPYGIRYLKTAEEDLYEAFEYIQKDNPSAALSVLGKFDKSISQLAINPYLGLVPKDDRLKQLGYRILIIEKYLVFYVVKVKPFKYAELSIVRGNIISFYEINRICTWNI